MTIVMELISAKTWYLNWLNMLLDTFAGSLARYFFSAFSFTPTCCSPGRSKPMAAFALP